MIGETISHYRILEKIGEGGMGVIYKARDTKLDRNVALKFISPQSLKTDEEKARFIQEAKAAAVINHPSITTVYEINEVDGNTFISMEHIQGESLKKKIEFGPLKIDEVLKIAIQIAEGLQEAHDKGIVHRDIKSANIMITEKGQVKIMDFGLAQLKGQSKLTKAGTTVGTAAYMSPEQSMGKKVDHRTDIWSLGVVLYEMITWQLPFKGDYEQAVIYSILNEEPEPITAIRTGVSTDIEKVIFKSLAKEPSNRYQHVDDLVVDLRKLREDSKPEVSVPRIKTSQGIILNKSRKAWIMIAFSLFALVIAGYLIVTGPKARPPAEEPVDSTEWENSVAVLPFRDFSPRKDQEYFCDGMTDAIIGKLSKLQQLKIISLTSVLPYKNQARNIKKIGAELDVETILEGSIQKEGDKIRVNVQLIQVADDSHLWQNTYNRELKSIFAIQDDISQAIVDALRLELMENEKDLVYKNPTENTEAYNLYMQGRFFWRKRTIEGLKKSIDFYKQALEIDPNFALAYSGLADTFTGLTFSKNIPREEGYAQAKSAALRAVELNEKSAEAHNSLALVLLEYDWDFQKARIEFERAIQLNPSYATAYLWYSRYYTFRRDFKRASLLISKAQQLDPLSPVVISHLAGNYLYSGEFKQAETLLKNGIELFPEFEDFYVFLGTIYLFQSRIEAAKESFNKIQDPFRRQAEILKTDLVQGKTDGLDETIKMATALELHKKHPVGVASLYGAAGMRDKCLEWLEKAYRQKDPLILSLKIWPDVAKYRDDPGFKELARKIGLDK